MNAFESINLNQSQAASDPGYSSDDGLDPNDFLSQSARALENLEGCETPTPLPSQDLGTSAVFDSVHSSIYNLESFSAPKQHVQETDSTIKYLRNRQSAFMAEMSSAIDRHMGELRAGEDCSGVRNRAVHLFDLLSENCLQQCEIYAREISATKHCLGYFQDLDQQRLKVLRRIKRIKSEKNDFGAKLDGLLAQRSDIDVEMGALEARLAALRAKRATVSTEIDGTISVLESKSAKYVNYFRHLEKAGRAAIEDYLASKSLAPESIATYVRPEKVSTFFVSKASRAETPPQEIPVAPSPSAMGMQALEIPEISKTAEKNPNSAYHKGFDTASKQLETLKRGVSSLMHTLKPARIEEPGYKPNKLDDSLNTITEKIDFAPILQLLTSKLDTLKQFEIQSSKASHQYRTQSAVWLDSCKFLEKQESALFQLISTSAVDTGAVQTVLRATKGYLEKNRRQAFEDLLVLIDQELFAVGTALNQLSEAERSSPEAEKSTKNE